MHRRDHEALEKMLADEYLGTDSNGSTINKEKEIADVRSGDFWLQSYKYSDLKVHVYGEVATVSGINGVAAEYRGRNVSGRFRFTDVFVKRDGRWQCVVAHSSDIRR